MMKKFQQKNIFYEGIYFSEDDSKEPVIIGSNVDEIIEKLLEITKDNEGWIEVYQISYNDRGYKIQLQKKFYVLNELEI
ncbi:MAG: hypothetical protein EU529_16155 [Promethearchaeota archaeon]|nr:MAG: hypothetical protein EU529_16155 [Candidatus Lokiarchaeota archaeon]